MREGSTFKLSPPRALKPRNATREVHLGRGGGDGVTYRSHLQKQKASAVRGIATSATHL